MRRTGFPPPEHFVVAWQRASSITHASVILVRSGYTRMTPQAVRRWGRTLWEAGVDLKRIRRPDLSKEEV